MFTIIWRIIYYGFKNFVRNISPSIATVGIMIIASSVFLSLILFNVLTKQAIELIQSKIDISVYFKSNISEDQILNIKQSLESLPEVKNVEYISKDKALEIFKENHKNDETIMQAISELNTNPLVASLNIKAKDPSQYALIANYISSSNLSNFIDSLSYSENQIVIDRLATIIHNINQTGFMITLILAFVAGLVIFNTIRLAIYSNREEIAIMRAVGASNTFVRGPYIINGILSGIIATFISIIIFIPSTYFINDYLKIFVPNFDIFSYYINNIFILTLYQLSFGVIIGAISSLIAIRKYLKN
ncbi:MAG: permease-like cell division protein FtsX [bacterium]|nr:ABC transporter permease [Patescibacteria group bacterium]MDW8279964.1 permease-like cell division protein FtsX [bacterium]